MSHEQPSLIWFEVIDFDGHSYKESSVRSVHLPSASDINGFRRAVIDANPDLFSSLDASQLKIYKDKTAFDRRENTLEADFLISGLLGLSDKQALVVLVPSTPVSSSISKQPYSKLKWGFWGLAFLMCHELDAVKCQEWRMLPLLNFLNDYVGYQVFTVLHVPIFAGILYGIHSPKYQNRILFQLSVFNMIHTGLHVMALWCPLNKFSSPLSWSLIIGGGVCGAIHVLFQ
jgi:hypothetical protein